LGGDGIRRAAEVVVGGNESEEGEEQVRREGREGPSKTRAMAACAGELKAQRELNFTPPSPHLRHIVGLSLISPFRGRRRKQGAIRCILWRRVKIDVVSCLARNPKTPPPALFLTVLPSFDVSPTPARSIEEGEKKRERREGHGRSGGRGGGGGGGKERRGEGEGGRAKGRAWAVRRERRVFPYWPERRKEGTRREFCQSVS